MGPEYDQKQGALLLQACGGLCSLDTQQSRSMQKPASQAVPSCAGASSASSNLASKRQMDIWATPKTIIGVFGSTGVCSGPDAACQCHLLGSLHT